VAKRYVVIIFQSGRDFIDRAMVFDLQNRLANMITTDPANTEIDLWIESAGGSAHAAYKLWVELRSRAHKIRAWVPDFAKSAATLLVLGVDEIYMSMGAELGPLDAQIEHPDREQTYISALDLVGALNYFSSFAIELAMTGGAALVKFTQLPRTDVLREILPFVAQLIKPCVDKIEPTLTRRAVSQLEVAEHYARRMIAGRNVPNNLQLSVKNARELTTNLVKSYPVHECVIGRQEAKLLGLPVYDAEKENIWPQIYKAYQNFCENFIPEKKSLLEILSFDKIIKNNTLSATSQEANKPKKVQKKRTKKETKKKRG